MFKDQWMARLLLAGLLCFGVAGLTACEDKDATDEATDAINDAANDAEDAANDAADAIDDAMN